MKVNKETIPALQNIKRREAFLLKHREVLPKPYLNKELLRIAHIRAERKLRWEVPGSKLETQAERIKETAKMFTPVPKNQGFFNRTRDWIDRKFRGN